MRTVRKAVGGIAWAACLCALLTAAPAHAQDGDQLFAQAEKSLEAGSYSEAIDQYSKSIRSGRLAKPTLAEAFLKRGRAYQLSGQHARAVADFTNALWLESLEGSNLASAHGWRGASRQALGQSSLAQEDLARATSLDPQFSAGPVTAVAADPSAPAAAQSASASSPAADSGGLIDSIFGGSEPQLRPRVAATAPAAPPAAPAESGQPGLLSRLFGSDESTRASVDGDASGITVRRLDNIGSSATPAPEPQAPATTSLASAAAMPAPAQASSGRPDVLSQILTASQQETSSDGATGPRAKPRATLGASPTRLASLDAAAPAPAASPSQQAGSPSLLDRIFGSGGQAAPAPARAAAAPAPRSEPITVSQSRVASAPPWQLGADNPTAAEERSALPPRVSGASSGFFSPTGVARESARGRTSAAPTRIASLRSSAAPEPAASAPAPAPAGPAAARTPEPIAATRIPAPQAREEAEPAQQDVARVAWSEATHVQRIAPPRPPTSPVASEPPAAAQPPVTQAPAVASRPEPTPAPTARPATRPVLAASASSPPSVASRIFEVARQAFGGAPAAPQQRVASVDTRQAPTGWGASARRAPTPSPVAAAPRTTARTPPRAQPQASGSGYVVQVSAERSLDAAKAKAGSLARQYGDLLGGARPYVVKADIPGKGTFFRVRIGPYGGQQQVAALCAQLKGRGQDCFTTRR